MRQLRMADVDPDGGKTIVRPHDRSRINTTRSRHTLTKLLALYRNIAAGNTRTSATEDQAATMRRAAKAVKAMIYRQHIFYLSTSTSPQSRTARA
jgi:hypothetical protein